MAKYKGACGTKDAVAQDSNRRVHFWVEVKNNGSCPLKVRFFKTSLVWIPLPGPVPGFPGGGFFTIDHTRELTKTVKPGDDAKVDRDEVNRVTISCEGEEEDGETKNCKFTYSITIN